MNESSKEDWIHSPPRSSFILLSLPKLLRVLREDTTRWNDGARAQVRVVAWDAQPGLILRSSACHFDYVVMWKIDGGSDWYGLGKFAVGFGFC